MLDCSPGGYVWLYHVRKSALESVIDFTPAIEENIADHVNALCARSGCVMFLREPQQNMWE